jgi:tetratricopeptide (TPR) repeat protein
VQDWLREAASVDDESARDRAVRSASIPDNAAEIAHRAVLAALYSDLPLATRLAGVAQSAARVRADDISAAFAAKSSAHIDYVRARYEPAISGYEEAIRLFDRGGAELESAKTRSSGLQALILLGRYDQAREWAALAQAVFEKHGDILRLARLESNVGNIFFRQDQPLEAIVHYEAALDRLQLTGQPTDVTAVLSNLAVCYTSLADFKAAFSCYERARELALKSGLSALAAQADYNIAYLYYLRGDYRAARDLYAASRVNADGYHAALCDLDEAEMALELNLTREGEALAARARRSFALQKMGYEQGKALVNLAVAASQRGNRALADARLRKARRLFVQEGNHTWSAMTDLLRGVLAFHDHRFRAAQKLSAAAWDVLAGTPLPGRAAHCQILLARLLLRGGNADRARAIGHSATERLGDYASPSIRFHASLLEGEIHEVQGRWSQAMDSYEAARREIEDLRGRVDTEDLRISLLKDKLAVYEALVSLCLDGPNGETDAAAEHAMLLVQEAKSRTLADRLRAFFAIRDPGEPFTSMRDELNWCYGQIERAESQMGRDALHRRARELEAALLQLRPQVTGPAPDVISSIADIQATLDEASVLLEFFEARGVLWVFLLSRRGVESACLGPVVPVRQHLRLLHFQISKSRAGSSAGEFDAGLHHLRELYRLLIAPVRERLNNFRHLVIAPHRELHGLPFAALCDSAGCLIDDFTIAITPSASVYAGCRARRGRSGAKNIVMGVPDSRSPHMMQEARSVAEMLPESQLFTGPDATIGNFREHASGARIVHLATHGMFRRDNPLFSAIQLADGQLNLIDLARSSLDAELVTLSACNTGSSVSVGGDELLGIIRGFLGAGARNLVVSLWEIDDTATMEFMKSFYLSILQGAPLAGALREAIREARAQRPHPYYWAAFVLVGAA